MKAKDGELKAKAGIWLGLLGAGKVVHDRWGEESKLGRIDSDHDVVFSLYLRKTVSRLDLAYGTCCAILIRRH